MLVSNPGLHPDKLVFGRLSTVSFFLCKLNSLLLFFFQGTLIQHLKEHILHGNMTSSDIIMYYTTASVAH